MTIFVILIEVTLLLLVILRYFVRFVVDPSSKRTISTRETHLCGIHHLDLISLACLQQAALISQGRTRAVSIPIQPEVSVCLLPPLLPFLPSNLPRLRPLLIPFLLESPLLRAFPPLHWTPFPPFPLFPRDLRSLPFPRFPPFLLVSNVSPSPPSPRFLPLQPRPILLRPFQRLSPRIRVVA